MCKSSITTATSSDTPLSPAVVASSGSPVPNEDDDLSMIDLQHEEEGGSPEPQEADVLSNTSNQASDTASEPASDSPLLPITGEPTVEVIPYSPQVEVNLESLLPGEAGEP